MANVIGTSSMRTTRREPFMNLRRKDSVMKRYP